MYIFLLVACRCEMKSNVVKSNQKHSRCKRGRPKTKQALMKKM